jgi:hypothetical protein
MKSIVPALIAVVIFGLTAGPAAAQAPDASGRWDVQLNTPDGPRNAVLTLKKEGEKLTGTIANEETKIPIEGTQKGADVSLSFTYRGGDNPMLITMKGTQKGDSIAGSATFGDSPGDWTGTRTAAAESPGRSEAAPAAALDISGAWLFEVTSPAGSGTPTITFNQSGETLAGQYVGLLGEAPIQGTLKGKDLSFSFDVTVQDTKVHVVYSGTATNDALKGTATFGELGEGTFTARRK